MGWEEASQPLPSTSHPQLKKTPLPRYGQLASTGQAIPAATTLPSPTALPTSSRSALLPLLLSQSPQLASLLPALSPLWKRVKTVSEVTWASGRAEVLAKKRQSPQLDGCLTLPTTPLQLTPSLPAPLALALSPPSIPFEPPDEPPSILTAPGMTALLPADPEQVLCKECRLNRYHIRFYQCSQCHMYPVHLYPCFKDSNGIYDD